MSSTQLSDEKLIAYLRDASSAGDAAAAKRALAILVYGYARDVERRMALRLPRYAVEDAAEDALVRAIAAAFDGTSVGEFRSGLARSSTAPPPTGFASVGVDRWRRRCRASTWATRRSGGGAGKRERGGRGRAAARCRRGHGSAERKPPLGRELHVFDGLAAAEVCERIDGMTADNVAQIASRFRKRLRDALEAADAGWDMSSVERLLGEYMKEHRSGGARIRSPTWSERRRRTDANWRLSSTATWRARRAGHLTRRRSATRAQRRRSKRSSARWAAPLVCGRRSCRDCGLAQG